MRTSVIVEDSADLIRVFIDWILIISKNAGPPYFVSDLKDQNVIINLATSFIFPQILDPDNDFYTVQVDLGAASDFA